MTPPPGRVIVALVPDWGTGTNRNRATMGTWPWTMAAISAAIAIAIAIDHDGRHWHWMAGDKLIDTSRTVDTEFDALRTSFQ